MELLLLRLCFIIFMWDIPVCGEYKTGTINRQSHTK